MGAAGGANPQEFNRLCNLFFYMRMNPNIPFVNGFQNPFFFNNNNNFNNCNQNMSNISMNSNNGFMNNNFMPNNGNFTNNNFMPNNINNNINNGYMNNNYINMHPGGSHNNMNMNNRQQNSFVFMNNLNNFVNNNANNNNIRMNNFFVNNNNMNNNIGASNMSPMNSMNNMNPMNSMNNMNPMNMSINNINQMNNMNNMNPMNMSINNMNNMNMQNNQNQIFDELNTRFMGLNLNQQNSINNAFTQMSSSTQSDFSNSSVNTNANTQIDLNEEITMNFKFKNGQMMQIKGRADEKFHDVFKRFRENECPDGLKNYMCRAVHNSEVIDNKKTLYENNIKNGDVVCFFFEDENLNNYKHENNGEENDDNSDNESISDESEDDEEEDEDEKKLVYNSWIEEYKYKLMMKLIIDILNTDTNENLKIDFNSRDFLNFLNEKYKELGRKIDEHEHKVIYTKTNYDWKCKECNQKYSKTESRFYCSICDYNMCNNCRKNKKYYIIGCIPTDAEPSNNKIKKQFIKHKGHEHRLTYCRTKRTASHGGWICNKCKDEFTNKVWTFYCTCCDYDLCTACAQKEKLA